MKNIQLTIAIFFVIFQTQAQSIQKSVIGAGGNVVSSGGIILRSTIGETATTSMTNGVIKITQGFQQNIMPNISLPVTGLDFYAQRITPSIVELQWQTLTEANNKGFYLERKLNNEPEYSTRIFIGSKADLGNSQTILKYEYADTNSFAGNTYYRIKQEDINGKNSYSLIRVVSGDPTGNLSLNVWPNPSTGFINVQCMGNSKTHDLVVLDAHGKTIKSIKIENQQSFLVDGLTPGIYFVSLRSDQQLTQKIVVQ